METEVQVLSYTHREGVSKKTGNEYSIKQALIKIDDQIVQMDSDVDLKEEQGKTIDVVIKFKPGAFMAAKPYIVALV